MSDDNNDDYEVGYGKPPKSGQFKKGQSGNPKGAPKKHGKTFEDELKAIFGKKQQVLINGKLQNASMRQLILKQIARGAAQGDPKMIRFAIPFLKVMDDAPEFEVLPEDQKALKDFLDKFNEDGDQ